MKEKIRKEILESWNMREGNVNSTPDLLSWIESLNKETCVNIDECDIEECASWYYDPDTGNILSYSGKFFYITGMRRILDG